MILCEPFAGMAGVSFWTLGCKPPISWMGGKSGYSRVIAELLGLSRLNPPRAYVWGDVGPNIAALACLFGAAGSAEEVGRWLYCAGGAFAAGDADGPAASDKLVGHDGWGTFGAKRPLLPRLMDSTAAVRSPRAPEVAAIIRGWRDEEPRALWSRLKAAGWPSLLLPEGSGGRWLGPQSVEEVAAWLWSMKRTHHDGVSFKHQLPVKPVLDPAREGRKWMPEDPAPAIEALPTKPPMVACWQGRAEDMRLPGDLSGWVCLLDPPYKGDCTKKITGYKHGDISRDHLLCLADSYDRRGATVAICESVSLRAEFGDGWYAVDIGGERKGQARTFGNTSEWVTMNRKPVVVPGVQASLFGGAV